MATGTAQLNAQFVSWQGVRLLAQTFVRIGQIFGR